MKGKGYLIDVRDERDYHATSYMLAGAAPPPPSADLRQHVDHVRDQGPTSSCVGQGIARAVHVRASVQELAMPFPSALAIYANARGAPPLTDDGAMPRDAIQGIQEWGVVPEARWPFDAAQVDTYPPWDVVQAGADATVDGYYRIDGPELVTALKQALALGYPVAFGQQVDQAFEDYSGDVLGPYTGKSLGGHYTCLLGYDRDVFFGINSWGTSWGEQGYYRVAAGRLEDPSVCGDFYAITVAPKGEH